MDEAQTEAPLEDLEPMEVAAKFESLSRAIKEADKALKALREKIGPVHDRVLWLIENEKLSHSFKMPSGSNIHLQSQTWASAKDGDHERLAAVLQKLGYVEFLPKTVNSHSISAFVREHMDEMGEVIVKTEDNPDGLPQELIDVLKISTKSQVKPTGL